MDGPMQAAKRGGRGYLGLGVGFFALVVAVLAVGTDAVRVSGVPDYAVALFFAAVAVAIMIAGRIRRRA